MPETRGERVLPRETIKRIYERAGLGKALGRQREAAHLSGERVEDSLPREGQQGDLAIKRLVALTANDRSGVPMRVLITEQPGY